MGSNEVSEFIKLLRQTFGRYEDLSGGCYKLHLILKYIYPEAVGYYNHNHVITRIGKSFYDIDGTVLDGEEKVTSGEYLRIGDGCDFTYQWMNAVFKEYFNE